MTIASEITRIKNNIASAYTAVNNKGGTLPVTQNSANLATAINSISGGGGGYTEFPSYQVVNGVASRRSGALTGNEFSNITSINSYGLYYAFYNCTGLTGSLDLSSLTSVSNNGLSYAFSNCTGITSVDLSSLTSVSGSEAMYYCFQGCTNLTSVDLSNLTTISGNSSFVRAFSGCTNLTSVNISSLTTISSFSVFQYAFLGSAIPEITFTSLNSIDTQNIFSYCFGNNNNIVIYFPALTTSSFGSYTNQFSNMFRMTTMFNTSNATVHFPSNLQSTVSSLSGYPNFGGSNTTIIFDLPATS